MGKGLKEFPTSIQYPAPDMAKELVEEKVGARAIHIELGTDFPLKVEPSDGDHSNGA